STEVTRVHAHLEHLAARGLKLVDAHPIRMVDDSPNQMVEGLRQSCVGQKSQPSAFSASAASSPGACGAGSAASSAWGRSTGFSQASASNAAFRSGASNLDPVSPPPLTLPQSPVSFSSAATCAGGYAPTESQYCARSEVISIS